MPMLVTGGSTDVNGKLFGGLVSTVLVATPVVVDARGMSFLTVVTGATGTATISRVNTDTAIADSALAHANVACGVASRTVVAVDWPFYRITAAVLSCDVACV